MEKILIAIEKVLKAVVITLTGAMLLWVCAMVPSRYLFNYTPSYGEELSRYMFVWIVFLSLPIVTRAGANMAIETITSRIHGASLKFARVTAAIFTLIFLVIMTWQGWFMVERTSFQISPGLEIPMSWVYISIPVGCGVMLLNVLYSFFQLLRTPANEVK